MVDEAGAIAWRGLCATDPQVLAETLGKRCPDVTRVVLEFFSASLLKSIEGLGPPLIR